MATVKMCTKSYDIAERTASFSFSNGVILTVKLEDLTAVLTQLALHGILQKVGDSFAGEKDVQEAVAKATDVLARLKQGEFKATREAKGPSTAIVVEAITRLRTKAGQEVTLEEIQARWETLPEEDQARVRNDPRTKAEVARIRAERLDAQADKASADTPADALSAFN